MTKDEKIDFLGCGVYILIILVSCGISFIISKFTPLQGNQGFWISFGIAAFLFGLLIFYGWKSSKDEPKLPEQKRTYQVVKPISETQKIPYILPYKSHCYNCKQSIHSSHNTYCDKCEHFRCNGCGRCFCGK